MLARSLIEESLTAVEQCLAKVGTALQAAQAEDLQQSSDALRAAAVQFSQALQGSAASLPPDVAERVRTVSARLTSQRDALARMSTVLDRQVRTVVPEQALPATYGASPGAGAGSAGAARIYRSPG